MPIKTTVSMREAASQITLDVQISGKHTHKLCMAIGIALIRMACWIIGIGYRRVEAEAEAETKAHMTELYRRLSHVEEQIEGHLTGKVPSIRRLEPDLRHRGMKKEEEGPDEQ